MNVVKNKIWNIHKKMDKLLYKDEYHRKIIIEKYYKKLVDVTYDREKKTKDQIDKDIK